MSFPINLIENLENVQSGNPVVRKAAEAALQQFTQTEGYIYFDAVAPVLMTNHLFTFYF
jgi:hypothetical protein